MERTYTDLLPDTKLVMLETLLFTSEMNSNITVINHKEESPTSTFMVGYEDQFLQNTGDAFIVDSEILYNLINM